jgi:hypothetical protein
MMESQFFTAALLQIKTRASTQSKVAALGNFNLLTILLRKSKSDTDLRPRERR